MTVDRTMLDAWGRTHLVFLDDDPDHADVLARVALSMPLDRATLEPVHSRLPGATIVIVTAANPGTRAAGRLANERAHAALAAAIADHDLRSLRCDGCSPDGTHREPGFAIDCDESTGRVLARRFGQTGFYVIAGDEASIVLDDGTHVRLPFDDREAGPIAADPPPANR